SHDPPNYNIIRFNMTKAGELTIEPEVQGLATSLVFDTVEIYGLKRLPTYFTVNNVAMPSASSSVVNVNVSGFGLCVLGEGADVDREEAS
ncbi:hypothetical protein ElyMa_003992500, partial [Elysia marginata]